MFEALIVTLREGIEAALVVGIIVMIGRYRDTTHCRQGEPRQASP